MNEILEQALLYDFYGELLTDHQKEVYEQFVLEDLSLGEIAREEGISRQGVHDLLKRCDNILQGYESKLHLVAKFNDTKEKLKQINDLALASQNMDEKECREQIHRIQQLSNHLIENY